MHLERMYHEPNIPNLPFAQDAWYIGEKCSLTLWEGESNGPTTNRKSDKDTSNTPQHTVGLFRTGAWRNTMWVVAAESPHLRSGFNSSSNSLQLRIQDLKKYLKGRDVEVKLVNRAGDKQHEKEELLGLARGAGVVL